MGSILGNVAGAVVGGLMGGDDGGEQQTNTKEPWAPARQPLINSLNTGQDLERYYQQTPFNRLQQQGYQNLYSDLDQFRSQISPQLMQFANNMMSSNYQRGPRNSQVEMMGQTQSRQPQMLQQGAGGTYSPQGGLLSAMGQSSMSPMNQNQSMAQGLLSSPAQGAFSAPTSGNYGLLDFTQLNPFTATNGIPKTPIAEKPVEKTPEQLAQEEWERLRQSGMGYIGSGA